MINEILETLKRNLPDAVVDFEAFGTEVYIDVRPEHIPDVCRFIYRNTECTLLSIFANDERSTSGSFRVYYAFALKEECLVIVFRTYADDNSEGLQSISIEIPAAALPEREIRDMFGIRFTDLPDNRELVFHPNWPEGCHPLRKDFDRSRKLPFVDREQEFLRIEGSGVFEIPVGPVHAGVIEPGHFRFNVAGEPVINLEAKLYYVHKGIEKLAEGQSFEKVFFLSERISGEETVTNSLAYCLALEKLAGIDELPERTGYLRTILCELERIYNHLGDIGGIFTDVAYGFAAYQLYMMRRWCMVLNEQLTGSRYLRSSVRPGGLRRDFLAGNERFLTENLDKLEKEFRETINIAKSNSLLIDRIENTGVVKPEIAVDLNAVGPAARSAGIDRDVRRDFPYAAYRKVNFKVAKQNSGDVGARMNVKIDEFFESVKIIRQCVEMAPSEGLVSQALPAPKPGSYAFGMTEAPRGENCHWLMCGESSTVFRYKIRTPSFYNWPVLCHAVKGNIIPDFPLINKSFNLSYAGNDL